MQLAALKAAWAAGEAVTNGWLHSTGALSAEVVARAGYDSVTLDVQHGMMEVADAVALVPALNAAGVVPFARVNWNEPAPIMKLLDAGVWGIICPMVNSRAEAEAFAGACRYAPLGYRSLGPTRAALIYGEGYAAEANDRVIALAMIETRAALDALDSILAVPGLDGIYVGPGDLSLSLRGRGGLDHQDPEMLGILEHIAGRARAAGKVAGLFTDSAGYAQQMRAFGYQFLTLSSDSRLLRAASAALVAAYHNSTYGALQVAEEKPYG